MCFGDCVLMRMRMMKLQVQLGNLLSTGKALCALGVGRCGQQVKLIRKWLTAFH